MPRSCKAKQNHVLSRNESKGNTIQPWLTSSGEHRSRRSPNKVEVEAKDRSGATVAIETVPTSIDTSRASLSQLSLQIKGDDSPCHEAICIQRTTTQKLYC